jgi:hypothetical protein
VLKESAGLVREEVRAGVERPEMEAAELSHGCLKYTQNRAGHQRPAERMKDEREAVGRHFILHPLSFYPARVPVYLMGGAMASLTLMTPLMESLFSTCPVMPAS